MHRDPLTASVQAGLQGRSRRVALWVFAAVSPVLAITLLAVLIESGVLSSAPTGVLLGVLGLLVLPGVTIVLERRAQRHVAAAQDPESTPSVPVRVVEHGVERAARVSTPTRRRSEAKPGVRSGAA